MQIPPEVRECVAFLAYRSKRETHLCGTVFFVSVSLVDISVVAVYAVTAKHCIQEMRKGNRAVDGSAYIRCNIEGGGVGSLKTNLNDWLEHPTADVAVIPIPAEADMKLDFKYIPLEMFVDDQVIERENFGLGDEVFLTGLFTEHSGIERNIPIIRVGNIACMPEEPVATRSFGAIDAYLVESRSIGGLSGSPVFTYFSGLRKRKGGEVRISGDKTYQLLGLMHGHWDRPHVAEDIAGNETVNMGIAIVIPAEFIRETIDLPELKAIRERDRKTDIAKHSSTPDTEPHSG